MQLHPKRPPGHASRKALRYVCEVHRLRAEGHSLEAIRLALLDAGISVSISTVRREVCRPPSQWDLDYAQTAATTRDEAQPDEAQPDAGAMSAEAPSPVPLEARRGLPDSSADAEPGPARIDAAGDHGTAGRFPNAITTILRRLRGAGWIR